MDIGTAYYNGAMMQSFTGLAIVSIIAILAIVMFRMRRTQIYRKHISDMYVAAKIRFFAKEDGLDIVEEEKKFRAWLKKITLEDKDLDDSVAMELKERIETSNEKSDKKK